MSEANRLEPLVGRGTVKESVTAQSQLPGILDAQEAPSGYFAVLKDDAKPADGSNICRACDWRPECQKSETDFERHDHRCMDFAVISGRIGREIRRHDGCSVVFKRMTPNAR